VWIGGIFGPFMLVWFAVLGLFGILAAPGVLAAVSPSYAISYILNTDLVTTLAVLAAVFLAVTGGEALYADMGHFGRSPLQAA
jgi:KUP system potassium uptake protein